MNDRAWCADVAAGASTLWERRSLGARPLPDREGFREERWERWTAEDPARLARRLAWDGLRPRDVQPLLGPVALNGSRPSWSPAALAARLRAARSLGVLADHPALRPFAPLPFEAAWLPLTVVESAWLRRRLPDGWDARLAPAAWAALERCLLRSLCHAGASVLSRELRARRAASGTRLMQLLSGPDGAGDTSRFAAELVADGFVDVLHHHPGLARLAWTLAAQWRRQTRLLLARLVDDSDAVAARLGVDLRRVDGVTPELSDRHDGGGAVARLVDADGRSVIYKPRDVALEAAFAALCADLGGPIGLPRAAATLARDDYGWMEDIHPTALADPAAAARYHRRAGALLALLHLLHANDAHLENLIAAGEHPVLVDGETLLGPASGVAADVGGAATRAGWGRLEASVLRTGLLPRWVPRADGGYDSAGLGPGWVQRAGVVAVRWCAADGEPPALDVARGDLPPGPHVPRLAGRAVGAEEHIEEVIAGFRDATRTVSMQARDALLARFAGCRARVLPRSTATYGATLLASVSADALADGAARSIVLDALHAEARGGPEPPPGWPLARAERRALERLDVPRFTAPVDRVPPRLRALWSAPGLAVARARLDAQRPEAEIRLIEATFYARVAAAPEADQARWRATLRRVAPADPGDAPPLDEPMAYAEAERIAARLLHEAVRAPDGSLTWVAPVVVHGAPGFAVRPVGTRLYDGAAGIALFFGGLARVTGRPEHAEAARAVLREIVLDPVGAVAGLAPGGVTGAASVVWALAYLADLLEAPELLATARMTAAAITTERLAQDPACDVAAGSAGALLAFLRLHAETGEDEWLARADHCGELLLARRTGSPAAWPGADGTPLTGLSHGAAGIAHALLSLAALTGDTRYADAAHEGLLYERLHFLPAHGNWEDLRPGGPRRGPKVMHGWCNGAPGIGLARLPWRALDRQTAAEVDIALATTRARAFGAQDHLCCGTLGRIEVLLRAGELLDRPALIGEARAVAGRVVARARRHDRYLVSSPELPPVTVPGLFRGLAGIGLQLLRLASPELVPSPLLLE